MKTGIKYFVFALIIVIATLLTTETSGQINVFRFNEIKCDSINAADSLDIYLMDKKSLAEKYEFKKMLSPTENDHYSISFMSDFQDSISIYINGQFQQRQLVKTGQNFGHALTIKIKKNSKNKEELTCVYDDNLFSFPLNYSFTYYTIYRSKSNSWVVHYSKCNRELE